MSSEMEPHRKLAADLIAQLLAAGVEALVDSNTVEGHIEVGKGEARSLRVGCVLYEDLAPASSFDTLGNDGVRLRRPDEPRYRGPVYFIDAQRDGQTVLRASLRDAGETIDAILDWLTHGSRERLELREQSIELRQHLALKRISEHFKQLNFWEHEQDLWLYGEGRSAKLSHSSSGFVCSFLVGPAQVALGVGSTDYLPALEAWILDRISSSALATLDPTIKLEPRGELIEHDPARWHWGYLLDRVAEPHNALAPMKQLVEALASSKTATAFYTFEEEGRLCFSATSHAPRVSERLPRASRHGDAYTIEAVHAESRWERVEGVGLAAATRAIEQMLAASPLQPVFGSARHHDLQQLTAALRRIGSPLRPLLHQHRNSYELIVYATDTPRHVTVEGKRVFFGEIWQEDHPIDWPNLDDAARAIEEYCVRYASLESIIDADDD
jgi:hypothetical protein